MASRFRATDGGEAEIYAAVEPETPGSLMLAAETQRRHLPGELQGEAVIVVDGRDIEEA